MSSNTINSKGKSKSKAPQLRQLPPTYQLGRYDVLCCRGKVALEHDGNRRFRSMVQSHLQEYSNSSCKYHKGKIVSHVVEAVKQACGPEGGGFVKFIDDAFFAVDDRFAREKVGQTFRDLLHTKYRSSTKAKARARGNPQPTACPDSNGPALADTALSVAQPQEQQLQQLLDCHMRQQLTLLPPFVASIDYSGTNAHNKQVQHTLTPRIPQTATPSAANDDVETPGRASNWNVNQWDDSKQVQQFLQNDGLARASSSAEAFLSDHISEYLHRHSMLPATSTSNSRAGTMDRTRMFAKLHQGETQGGRPMNGFHLHHPDTVCIPEPTPLQESPPRQSRQGVFQYPPSAKALFQHQDEHTNNHR